MRVWSPSDRGRREAGNAPRARPLKRRSTPFAAGLLLGVALALADSWRGREPAPQLVAVGLAEAASLSPHAWRRVFVRSAQRFSQDSITATAAGITYYMLLAIFPGLGAFVSLYGLIGDVNGALRQLHALRGVVPAAAVDLLRDQLTRLALADHGALGLAFVAGLVVSLWSANAGATSLINGLNVAYKTRERRGFVHLTLLSLSFTAGAVVLAVLTAAVLVDAPPLLARWRLSAFSGLALLRWPVFAVATVLLLSVLYRYGPARTGARWRWITPGGCFAALAWLAMSALFSIYVANFGHYDRTYGSLGAVVGFLTWIWLTLMVVLFGAEMNAQVEQAVADRPRSEGRARTAPGRRRTGRRRPR